MSDNTRRTKLEQRLDEIEATIGKLHDQIREARTLAAGENPVGHVIAFWVLSWKNAHGGTYELTKQDAANLTRLVNQHGLEELEGRMIRYLGDSDPWLARQEHPLSSFVARLNSYQMPWPAKSRNPKFPKGANFVREGNDIGYQSQRPR